MTTKKIPRMRVRSAKQDDFDRGLAAVNAARAERRRICHLNLLAAPGAERGRIAPELRDLLAAETAGRRALKRKQPEEWARDIGALDDEAIRNRVASIVWWDYFGGRPAATPWPHLNRWLKAETECVAHEELARALWRVGFTPAHAAVRVAGEWQEGDAR